MAVARETLAMADQSPGHLANSAPITREARSLWALAVVPDWEPTAGKQRPPRCQLPSESAAFPKSVPDCVFPKQADGVGETGKSQPPQLRVSRSDASAGYDPESAIQSRRRRSQQPPFVHEGSGML